MQPLRPYQEASRDWLASPFPRGDRGRLLADGPRVGKTWPSIDAAKRMGARYVNVVCPASVVGNWEHYLRERQPSLITRVVSFDRASRQEGGGADVLIVDESHYLKTPTTKRTLAIFGERCERDGWAGKHAATWCLSGTPTPNYSNELWPMLRRLAPDRIIGANGRPMDFYAFTNQFCEVFDNGFGTRVVGNRNTADLRERLKGFVLRRTWSEVSAQVKPDVTALRVSAKWPAGIDEGVKMIADAFERGGVDALKNLKTPANVPPEVAQGAIAKMRRAIGMAKVIPVLEIIEPAVRSGEKVCLYAHHADVLDALEAGVQKMGVGYERIDGSVSQEKRTARASKFREDPRCLVFLGQNVAAGAGIDLSSADWLILLEPSYVPGDNEQIINRVMNINKDRPVTVNFAAVSGTIDDRIQSANIRKIGGIVELLAA